MNVGLLESDERIKAGETITKALLAQYGYIRKPDSGVKILGNGEIKKKLTFDGIDAISASALKKVEAAGGTFSGGATPVAQEEQKEETQEAQEEQKEESQE